MCARALVCIVAGATLSAAQARFESTPRAVATGRDPSLAVRASGAVSMLAVEKGDLWLLTSFDGGDSFEQRVRVNDVAGEVASHGENSPRLHMRSRSEVYCLWQARAAESGGSALRVARSADWGETFEKSVLVDAGAPASQAFSALNVSPRGQVYVAWLDGRERGGGHAGTSALYLARSADRGRSFEPSVRVSRDVCPCCRPSIAFTGEQAVHVAFRGVTGDHIRDILIATSHDGGARWGKPVPVAEDNWRIHGCPHSGASLAVLGKRLFVSWYTVREGHGAIYYAWSDDGGRTFSERRPLSEAVIDANHPHLLPVGDAILAVFQGREPDQNQGWGKIGVYCREIDAGGRAAAPVRIEPAKASASYPVIAFGQPDQVFLAWTESAGESGHSVVLARGRRAGHVHGGSNGR
jgi:hypothetical protein